MEAKYVKAYPSFDHPSLDNDIGVIELKEKVKLTGMWVARLIIK